MSILKEQDGRCDRLRQAELAWSAHGHSQAPAPTSCLTGLGRRPISKKRGSAIESDFGVKAIYSPANMSEPMEIANMISLAETNLRPRRRAHQ